jgi:hypothetical protein
MGFIGHSKSNEAAAKWMEMSEQKKKQVSLN